MPESVVTEFTPRLLRFFASLGADPRTAEDLTQELFLRLIRTSAPYQEQGKLAAYLFRIAYRLWIDEIRVRRPSSLPEEEFRALENGLDPAEGPLSRCLRHESEDRLRRALEQLPAEQRTVFELGVVQGIRYREIAGILRIPVGTVKSRIFTAAGRLKKLLEEKAQRI